LLSFLLSPLSRLLTPTLFPYTTLFRSDDIVGKTAPDLYPKAAADAIAADDEKALQSPEGLFLDISPWQSQALGQRFITSRRIGIPDHAGQTRYIINIVDDVTDRRRADEKIAHLAHYDALT